MRLILVLILVFCAAPINAKALRVDLGGRFYLIDLPDHPSGAMIVALHAAARSPEDMRATTGLSTRALAKGYGVIYPLASGATKRAAWNGFY